MPYRDVRTTADDLRNDDDRMEYAEWAARYECGLLLSKAREREGLTQEELAKLAKVSQAYVSKIENAEANPSVGRLARLLGAMWLRLTADLMPLVPQAASYEPDFSSVQSASSEPQHFVAAKA
ncbi:MAG: helix-turn-helix transcriptional regulator [Chloroflexi bacterium]|nr:helix-turn-helix transcriptional regulator [Chloroflexota bacterium]